MAKAKLKDSDKRRQFKTGGMRDSVKGKGRCDLLPVRAMLALSKHFQHGAEVYEERNWEKGLPLSCFIDSDLRHLFQTMIGQINEKHLVSHAWNALCLLDTALRIKEGKLPKELNDLPELNLENLE